MNVELAAHGLVARVVAADELPARRFRSPADARLAIEAWRESYGRTVVPKPIE